ncbi:hypothetical protein BGZ74_000688 [Mortierella antarctica]|nr:hypothetical protein BGZ74_000688 [Mortierella antarctica]
MVSENLDDEVVLVRAMYDFDSEDATNLTFKKDDVIQVLAQLESGWWAGHCQGRQGWFPSNYVELLNEDDLEDSDEDEEGDDLDVFLVSGFWAGWVLLFSERGVQVPIVPFEFKLRARLAQAI